MVRSFIIFLLFLLVYYLLMKAMRSFRTISKTDEATGRSPQIRGEEMVEDPECKTYILKQRAIGRHINGKLTFFCSEECAREYEKKNRG